MRYSKGTPQWAKETMDKWVIKTTIKPVDLLCEPAWLFKLWINPYIGWHINTPLFCFKRIAGSNKSDLLEDKK